MKQDEIELMNIIKVNKGRIPSSMWESLTKRQYYILSKWADKGLWEYGVSLRSGWLSAENKEESKSNEEVVK